MTRKTSKLLVMACRCVLADLESLDYPTDAMLLTIEELKNAIQQAEMEGYNGYEI